MTMEKMDKAKIAAATELLLAENGTIMRKVKFLKKRGLNNGEILQAVIKAAKLQAA